MLQIEPMLAEDTDKKEHIDSALQINNLEWIAEEKYDGSRYIAHFTGKDPVGDSVDFEHFIRFTSRRTSVKDGLKVEKTENIPHLSKLNFESLAGTILDGEIISGEGTSSNKVTSIMGSLPEKAIEKQKEFGYVDYVIWDILYHKGKDIQNEPWSYRRSILKEVVKELNKKSKHFKIAQVMDLNKEKFCKTIIARGGEGIILKNIKSPYLQGERNWRYWCKVKRERTWDVVCTGFDFPEKWSVNVKGETVINRLFANNWISAIKFGIYRKGKLEEFGQTSGMSDEERAKISQNQNQYIGQVLTVEGQEVQKDKIRHPRFICWRDDKDPKDCIWSGR